MLYFFGDSHTYGTGLSDCITHDNYAGPHYSKFAFPTIISSKLKIPYKNFGIDGASNQQIFFSMRSSNITTDDIAIVCWSHWSRNFALNTNGPKQILAQFKDCEPFYGLYDDNALQYASLLTIEHANFWFASKSIRLFNFSIYDQGCDESNAYIIDKMHRYDLDLALDGIHFGEETHRMWAHIVSENIVKVS